MEYKKPPKTFEEQIKLIKDRGLIVDDEARLEKYLVNISYYHLSAYFKSFQDDDKFREGITFEDVIKLYEFDKKLRLLLLDVLERIEKSFKCSVIYNLSILHNNPFWYVDQNCYTNEEVYNKYIVSILDDIKNSREVSIRHFYEKYTDSEYPPAWTALEILSFGGCVKLCRQLNRVEQNYFSRPYGLDKKYFINWMHGLSLVRNICAHHTRLWNKNIILPIKYNHKVYKKYFNENERAKMRLFNWLVVVQIMMCKINPSSSWLEKLKDLIKEYNANIVSMGFPEDWEERFEEIKNTPISRDSFRPRS